MNKDLKKIIVILVKVIVIGIIVWLICGNYINLDDESTLNTYYDNTNEIEKEHRLSNVKRFIKYIEEEKYEQAYDFLSVKCKEEKFKNVEEFKDFINKFLIAKNKPEKSIYYEAAPGNESNTNIRVMFAIKNVDDYYDAPTDDEGMKYYDVNILNIAIEEKTLIDYKYYIDLVKYE